MWGSLVAFLVALRQNLTAGKKAPGGTKGPSEPVVIPKGAARPIAVGVPGDPKVAALLTEMNQFLAKNGVDTSVASAREFTLLPKTPEKVSAIPPREYWPAIATLLREVFVPLRKRMGMPLEIRGFRPVDYNAKVGGARYSRHIYATAMDIYVAPPNATTENKNRLKLEAASIYLNRPDLKIGFGAYNSNVHLDWGWKRRTWKDGAKWVKAAKRVA